MSPSWARKGSKRWRYYVSQAALQGDKSKAGSIVRVPAAALEALVIEAIGKLSSDAADTQTDIRNLIDRVTIGRAAIQLQLLDDGEAEAGPRTLTLPWSPPSPYRKREIIQSVTDGRPTPGRCAPTRVRSSWMHSANSHLWLDQLLSDPNQSLEFARFARGQNRPVVRMALSLAFLAPDIVQAAVEGRLPRGYGLKRLVDLPMSWPDQWRALGLEARAHA